MINWQCFLNLAMEIGQCFRIVSLETGQRFQIVSLEQGNVMIESIALFPRTRFGSVALFPWPNSGSVASLSCPKLGNIATFWRKCSTRLEPFYEFFTHLELEFLNFIYHSWIRKHSSLTYQKLVNQFRVPLRETNASIFHFPCIFEQTLCTIFPFLLSIFQGLIFWDSFHNFQNFFPLYSDSHFLNSFQISNIFYSETTMPHNRRVFKNTSYKCYVNCS